MNTINASNRREQLTKGMAMLETLAFCREQANRPELGRASEKAVVDAMLVDLAMCTRLDELNTSRRSVKGLV